MIALKNKDIQLYLSPEQGATVLSLIYKGINVLRPSAPDISSPQAGALFPMLPYCSYIQDGHFNYFGINRIVPPNQPDLKHPIHGDGWLASWTVEKETRDSVTLTYTHNKKNGFPFDYKAKIIFALRNDGLDITLSLTNPSNMPFPCGLGIHPYFIMDEKALLTFNSSHIWYHQNDPIFDRPYPTPAEWNFSSGKTIQEDFNTAFGGWDGQATIQYSNHLTIKINAPDIFHHLLLYKPKQATFFCLEPISNTPNAFNLASYGVIGTGIQSIGAKQTLSKTISLDFSL